MAKSQKDKQAPDLVGDGDEAGADPAFAPAEGEQALAQRDADDAATAESAGEPNEPAEGDVGPAQLGTQRYVLAGFFAGGMLLAYVLGRMIHGVWAAIANKDWFARALPALAAVTDEDKSSYGAILGGLIALVVVVRTYRKPEVRAWSDDVASELAKVKWPTKKDVTNSTIVVIAASTVATLYLALLDRFWSFVTNIVYGDGS